MREAIKNEPSLAEFLRETDMRDAEEIEITGRNPELFNPDILDLIELDPQPSISFPEPSCPTLPQPQANRSEPIPKTPVQWPF